MKISCQSCHSKYNVADEKVQGKIVKIRCRKCGATIVVNASGAAAANGSVPAPATSPQPASDTARGTYPEGGVAEWHVSISDNDQRTMSLAELVNAYNTGVVVQDTFVWTEGMQDWKPLGEVDAVVSALHALAGQPAAVAAAYDYGLSAPVAPSPAYEQAGPTQAYEPAAVYGGGFTAQAAVAPGVAQEPKRAAVVRREGRARDLFATRTGEELRASAQPDGDDDGRLTGQRNENSVLFSLEHLTKSAADERSTQGRATAAHDDSGVIDLKALAAKAESMRPPTLHDANSAMPQLGFTPPPFSAPIGGLGPLGSEAQPRSKLPLLIGGGAGIALLLVLGIVIGLKIGGAVSPGTMPAASIMTLPLPSAAPAPTVEPTASPSAAAQASASAAPVAKVRAYGGGGGGGGAWHGNAGGGAKPPTAGAGGGAAGAAGGTAGGSAAGTSGGAAAGAGGGTAPAAPPKKNDCGCNGDLMCMMKCSTH
jgi:predicted Zn finger-like uncharacterized protein